MSWEPIDNIAPAKAASIPPKGVAVAVRTLGLKSGGKVRYIRMVVGPLLAKSLCLITPEIGMRLALGGGEHAGQVALSVDNTHGNFRAKRAKDGSYVLTINAASADGLFSLTFAPFAADAGIVHARDTPPMAAFRVPADMLAAD